MYRAGRERLCSMFRCVSMSDFLVNEIFHRARPHAAVSTRPIARRRMLVAATVRTVLLLVRTTLRREQSSLAAVGCTPACGTLAVTQLLRRPPRRLRRRRAQPFHHETAHALDRLRAAARVASGEQAGAL